jgi:hypothetical protein
MQQFSIFMQPRFLLYIDILGFKELTKNNEGELKILELHQKVRAIQTTYSEFFNLFQFIFFSDTLLVYTKVLPDDQYTLTHLCEVAKNLCFNFREEEIYFRAILCHGGFSHSQSSGQHFFYGESLITAYESEKSLSAHGLFIHKSIDLTALPFSFEYDSFPFSESLKFLSLCKYTSKLSKLDLDNMPMTTWPDSLDGVLLIDELFYLKSVKEIGYSHADPSVRNKHLHCYSLYRKLYPTIISLYEDFDFDEVRIKEHLQTKNVWLSGSASTSSTNLAKPS